MDHGDDLNSRCSAHKWQKPKLPSYGFVYENSGSCLSSHMFASCHAVAPSTGILHITVKPAQTTIWEPWFLNAIDVSWHHVSSFKLYRGEEFTVEIRKFCNLAYFKVVFRRSCKRLSKHHQPCFALGLFVHSLPRNSFPYLNPQSPLSLSAQLTSLPVCHI